MVLGALVLLAAASVAGIYFYDRYRAKPAPEEEPMPTSYLENVEQANTVETLQNDEDKAAFYASLGGLAADQGDNAKALDYYLKSLNLTEQPQGWLYLSIAVVYERQNDSTNALSYYQKALDFYNQAGEAEFIEERAHVEERIGQLQGDGE